MTEYSYQIDPRPETLGGGYRLRLLCDGAEVGGGVFPADASNADAYEEAIAEASAWLASRSQASSSCHMLTFSGRDYLPTQMVPADVHIEDVAHALSLICRFGGHTEVHYSVAQHSLLVVRILDGLGAPREAMLCGLMHDAHEAYVGDVPTPIKALLGATWAEVEHQAEVAVLAAYGLERAMTDWHELIRHADRIALATERRDLMCFDAGRNRPWTLLTGVEPHPLPATEGGWTPEWWAALFLDQFRRLGGVQIHPVHAAIYTPTRSGVSIHQP